jgi:hypothetical protein
MMRGRVFGRRYFREKITMTNVLTLSARPRRPAHKPWVGPIEAERERCLAVCLHPAARGHWGSVARTLLCETALSAEDIIDMLKNMRAETAAEIQVDLAAGLFNRSGIAP